MFAFLSGTKRIVQHKVSATVHYEPVFLQANWVAQIMEDLASRTANTMLRGGREGLHEGPTPHRTTSVQLQANLLPRQLRRWPVSNTS